MSIDERTSDALFNYCIARRDRARAVQDEVEIELRAAIEQHVAKTTSPRRQSYDPRGESTTTQGNDMNIEQEIQAVGANVAPRITPADIEAAIGSEHYFTGFDGALGALSDTDADPITAALGLPRSLRTLTFCVLVLRNGFTVTGESACASPENFNAEIGRKVARQNAVAKVWPLLGYELRTQLSASADNEVTK